MPVFTACKLLSKIRKTDLVNSSKSTNSEPTNQLDETSTSGQKTAWVAGATGLIGQALLKSLCEDAHYDHVVAFVRPSAEQAFKHSKLSHYACNWDHLLSEAHQQDDTIEAPSENVDELYCALGSTTKKTPDKDLYKKIDVEYPEAFASFGKKHGARFYGLVSAHGVTSKLPSFYLSMKKDVEARIVAQRFASTAIARPSLLLGDRGEFRFAEKTSEWLCKLLPGNYKAIEAGDVAAALVNAALADRNGVALLESAAMQGASERG